MMRLLLASIALILVSACKSEPVHPEGAAVLIKDSHVHTRYCGHYRFGEQWYFLPQHRHGVDCGHVLRDGDWVLEQK